MSTNLHHLTAWYDRVWKQCDASAIDEMFASQGTAHGLGDHPRIGPKEFAEFHKCFCALMDQFEVSIDHHMEEANTIYALCTFSAVRKTDGAPVSIGGIVLVTFEDGKIVDAYNHWDFIGLFQQLELMPPESLLTCLSGKSIG